MELASTSVFDHPLINPGLLASDFDTQVMIEGVKAAKRFVSASPWQGYIAAPFIDSINTTTDAGIEAYARQFSTTIRHPIGTAAMSKDSDKGGVVGPQLNVKNVVGLRVVDASVFVSTNTSQNSVLPGLTVVHDALALRNRRSPTGRGLRCCRTYGGHN